MRVYLCPESDGMREDCGFMGEGMRQDCWSLRSRNAVR